MPYEDEIPKELEEGKIYTSKTVRYVVAFNKGVTVLCEETNDITDTESIMYKVIKKLKSYIVQHVNGCMHTKSSKDVIYIVKRVS